MAATCKPLSGARFFMKKYAINCDDANKLALHPKLRTIVRDVETWRDSQGAAASSPLARGYLLHKLSNTRTGLGRARRRR
jgi:hypothetical protein